MNHVGFKNCTGQLRIKPVYIKLYFLKKPAGDVKFGHVFVFCYFSLFIAGELNKIVIFVMLCLVM